MHPPLEDPLVAVRAEAERLRAETPVIFVDVHGETTSEKIAVGRYLDGLVSGVVGTHTHVQTADERIFPGGTAFLCDAGMCGPDDSILGRRADAILTRFLTSMPTILPVARGPVRLCGAILSIDETTGRSVGIERFQRVVEVE
jgi:calcineurin-like phosphoesterase